MTARAKQKVDEVWGGPNGAYALAEARRNFREHTTLFTNGKTAQQIQGFVERTPLGRLGEPEDIANVVSTLVSGDGAWVSGQTVFANGAIV